TVVIRAARAIHEVTRRHRRVPDAVPLAGGLSVPPAAFLRAVAVVYRRLIKANLRQPDESPRPIAVSLADAEPDTARFVKPVEQLHWDWPIFPKGFNAPRLIQHARLQAWTLKPAVRTA
ncbi:MAG: hypothetical protein WD535_05525, partial [Thermaerobacterales bacterium]